MMYHPFKRIRIAVIGTRSSGKSFLLYDMIHAFTVLGYHPEELPLSYPHSSFGTFFYDNFNSQTGSMRGTESYACRPLNHYGAYLSGNYMPMDLAVDFLNIPGEVFDDSENRIELFFKMKELIQDRDEDMFYMSEWKSPSGQAVRLIVPKDFSPNGIRRIKASFGDRHGNYLSWGNILYDLEDGKFKEKKKRKVSGEYIFKHITELNIDSLLQTLKTCWPKLARTSGLEWVDLVGKRVIHYFYPLAYCDQATDIVLCDKLMDDDNITNLEENVCYFFKKSNSVSAHIYLAFRAVDTIILKKPDWHRDYVSLVINYGTSIGNRNTVYSLFLTHLQDAFKDNDRQLENTLDHIKRSVGDNFWTLLNYAYQQNLWQRWFSRKKTMYELRQSNPAFLPPHVYFTATPIDARFTIFENDTDVTRFYYNTRYERHSFTREVLTDMSRHMCFGSLQLLTDILVQNGKLPWFTTALQHRSNVLKYYQYQF